MMMSASIPPSSSSIADISATITLVGDILSVLELASDPAKVKKLLKELQSETVKYAAEKKANDEKLKELEDIARNVSNMQKDFEVSSAKNLSIKAITDDAIKELEVKTEEFKKLEADVNAGIEKNANEKKANDAAHASNIRAVKVKELEMIKAKEDAEKLSEQLKEKLDKLRAATA